MTLADPFCRICATWMNGDPACPIHCGTYKYGTRCPTCGAVVIICQHGAAYVCFRVRAVKPSGGVVGFVEFVVLHYGARLYRRARVLP